MLKLWLRLFKPLFCAPTLWESSVNFLSFSHVEYSSQAKILSLNILEKYRIKSCRIIVCTQFSNSINFLYNLDLITFTFLFFIFSKATIKPPLPELKKSDGNNIKQW